MRLKFTRILAVCHAMIAALSAHGEVVLYPGPSQGALAQLTNLRKSDRYTVTINGESLFVYASTNRTGPDPRTGENIPMGRIKEAHFCYFSFRGDPVSNEVERLIEGTLQTATLHPARLGLSVEVKNGEAVFELGRPRKLALKTEIDELHPLVYFADKPDTDIPSDPVRFPRDIDLLMQQEPGIHCCVKCGFKGAESEVRAMYKDVQKKFHWNNKRFTQAEQCRV